MQAVYKVDIVFKAVYAAIILLTGIFLFFSSKNPLVLFFALGVGAVYLFFALRIPYRRFRAVRREFPGPWREFLSRHSRFYSCLDGESKKRFEQDVQIFLSAFPIEGIRREELDIETKLLVAAGVATLLHGRPFWEPPIKDGVLVYPGNTFSKDFKLGKGQIAGRAGFNSPLIVTQENLKRGFENPDDGHNVIIHELAHYFDMENGIAGGIPSGRIQNTKPGSWKRVITREWRKALAGSSFLGSYAGTNEAELFAVAVEFFFEKPHLVKRENPGLYDLLRDFFNLDTVKMMPAGRSA